MAEETCERVEIPSFSCETAFIHVKIPAATTLGHRADSWGVDRPDVTCRLAALTKGDTFIVRLWLRDATTQSEETFAEAFWYPDSLMSSIIHQAADSSRYFALKISNLEEHVHTFIGLGFADRDAAGNFKEALHQHGLYLQRMQRASVQAQEHEEHAQKHQPEVDMSLSSSGIRVKLPAAAGGGFRPGGFLATQRAKLQRATLQVPLAKAAIPAADGEDDEFGDFVG